MSIASRVFPCSVRMSPLRKRACGSRGFEESTLFTRSSACGCWPALSSLVASCSSSARAGSAATRTAAASATKPWRSPDRGAAEISIVLYFQGPTKRCMLDYPPRVLNPPSGFPMLKIDNTLGRSKQEFIPLRPGEVRMYVCGMTVYDYLHLGHARMMVVFDLV